MVHVISLFACIISNYKKNEYDEEEEEGRFTSYASIISNGRTNMACD